MSYSSSLSAPSVSSGNVGLNISASNLNQVVFAQNVSSLLASLTLPAGVWAVSYEAQINLNATTTFGNGILQLQGSFSQGGGAITNWAVSQLPTTTTDAINLNYAFTSVITLTASSVVGCYFSTDSASGSGNVDPTYIWAVKLA